MIDCTCDCQCKPDSISFFWMNDNHTFVRLKGKNLKEIIAHANKIRKKSKYGVLCPPTLLRKGKDFRRVGECVHDDVNFVPNVLLWIEAIEKDKMAMELIAKGCIEK